MIFTKSLVNGNLNENKKELTRTHLERFVSFLMKNINKNPRNDSGADDHGSDDFGAAR